MLCIQFVEFYLHYFQQRNKCHAMRRMEMKGEVSEGLGERKYRNALWSGKVTKDLCMILSLNLLLKSSYQWLIMRIQSWKRKGWSNLNEKILWAFTCATTERADVLAHASQSSSMVSFWIHRQRIFRVVLTTEDEIVGDASRRKRRRIPACPAASGIFQWNLK